MGKTRKIFLRWAEKNQKKLQSTASCLALAGLAWLVLGHAWFTDDAYFSFRSVDNFVNGYGLTWNVSERVQAYTHPLWVLLLSVFYFFTHEIYLTTILISLALTIGLAILILRSVENKWRALAAVFLLTLSTAFADYTTSGLENPLSHLLLGIFLIVFMQKGNSSRKLFWMALLAALGAVNRLDTVLFYLPALLYEWWQHKDRVRAAGSIALAFIPLIAWEIFSLVYYGFPFPNTYYAKAQNYVALGEEVWAGLNYFLFTLKFDPLTWLVIAAAFVTAGWQRQKQALAIMLGVWFYLVYILQIGGDFMGGRFLSTAYLGSVFVLLYFLFPKLEIKKHWVLIPAVLALSLIANSPPYFLYAKGFQTARWNGVVDERMVYYATDFLRIEDLHAFNADPSHNLLNKIAFFAKSLERGSLFRFEAENDWIDLGRSLAVQATQEGRLVLPQGANGFTGYYAGPDVYIVNNLALTDGLLARLPPIYNPNWRSGHFKRLTPPGYLEAETGTQAGLDDPILDAYFQKIRLVIEGPLFTPQRWAAIWELNTKNFNELLPGYSAEFRFPALQTIALEAMPQPGTGLNLNLDFGGQGSAAQIDFPQLAHLQTLQLGLSAGDNFRLVYLDRTGFELSSQQLISKIDVGAQTYSLLVPQKVAAAGFAAIRLVPIRVLYDEADGQYRLSTISFQ
jgi:arabinofuranosyltransferase